MRRLTTPALAALSIVAACAVGATYWWLTRPRTFTLAPRADRNVLLITIDTLRADAISAYGGGASTPRLDALAAHGARFTFAHSHAVVTLPSHASLLTGTYPYAHGVRDNNGYRVRGGQSTLATRLKPLGFATGAFVGGFPLDQRFGLNAGFDVYDDRIGEVGSTVDFALPERRADAVVAPALQWIGAQPGKWLAWVHVFDPHAPYRAPEEFAKRYPSDPYAAEVAWTDFALGPLFDRLAALPRPTLVIVTADHGESLGEHGELTHGIFAYESTLRVPLIIAELGGTAAASSPRAGVTIDTAVRHVDVVPTVLDAVGAAADGQLAGSSLRPLIAAGGGDDRPSYFEAMTANLSRGWAPLRGVIAGRDKYIDLPIPELYALPADPQEQQNLAASRRERTEVLVNTLRGFNVAPPALPGEETSAVRERLRALGYVGGSPASPRDRYGDADDPKKLIDIDALLHRAGDFYQRGQPQHAAALFQEAIRRRPDTADAYRYLAFVYWQEGQPANAIRTLETALQSGISHRDVRVKLGIYLAETGTATRAIALLEGLAGDDIEALNALGIAYGQAGRSADAMRTFTRSLEIDPSNGLAWQNIGTLQLRGGDRQAAETSLRRALTIDDTLPGAYTTLGVVLSDTNRKAEAVDMWKRAVALSPGEFDALYNLTVTLVDLGRRDEAHTYGERFVTTAPPAFYARDIESVRRMLK
ncbi:MAG TPA: sulfatase-like hydrolase/transferase [Vicinamibacterales bacterium]|nr:sulfatase-like hydrolase/transferase [Vicinamibacterales bacterium]